VVYIQWNNKKIKDESVDRKNSDATKKESSGAYTGCHRRNGPNFGRVFLMLNYTDITQNTYVPS